MESASPMARGVPPHIFEQMVTFRRDLHHHPELSGKEQRTAGRIADELRKLGLSPRTGVGGHGVVADIDGADRNAGLVAIRGDMDALPVQEETGLPFASCVDGVMHACGHDAHASMVLGAATLLATGDPPPVGVRLVFQPSEEKGTGALAMIADDVLDGVHAIFGGHVDRHYPPGVLAIQPGAVNASTDQFRIHIHGRGGHGARPHEGVDAVVVGSLLVTAIQTIVSREVDPSYPSVVSVGSFQAGSAPNVIAATAQLEGTVRAHHAETRVHLTQAIVRIAEAIGRLHGARVEVDITPGTPPVINTPAMTQVAREAASEVVEDAAIVNLRAANMGGEDFAHYLQHVSGCYVRFGSQAEGREGFPAHSSRFDPDERALAIGAAWFAAVARIAGEQLRRGELPRLGQEQ